MSLPVFRNGQLAAEQFFIDSRQPAWLEPGQSTEALMFRTIAKRKDKQEARQRDQSSKQSDFRFQIRLVYAAKAAVSAAE